MNAIPDLPESALEERDALVKRLIELIQTVTDEELLYIAEADLQATPHRLRKQEATLRMVIFKRRGRMTEKHAEFPGEVLSLIAEDGGEHLDRAFEIATAVLMINGLLYDDHDGAMSLLWAEHGPAYARIDRAFAAPILAGFLWLATHATDWDFLPEPDGVPSEPKDVANTARAGPPAAAVARKTIETSTG